MLTSTIDMHEEPQTELSNEDLRAYVNSLIDLHNLLKEKRAEIRKYNATYKQLAEKVKHHAITNSLKYIDSKGSQVHVYTKIKEPVMNPDFISSHLKGYFIENGDNLGKADDIMTYLMKHKKSKDMGESVIKMTIRNAKVNTSLKRKAVTQPISDDTTVDEQTVYSDDNTQRVLL